MLTVAVVEENSSFDIQMKSKRIWARNVGGSEGGCIFKRAEKRMQE